VTRIEQEERKTRQHSQDKTRKPQDKTTPNKNARASRVWVKAVLGGIEGQDKNRGREEKQTNPNPNPNKNRGREEKETNPNPNPNRDYNSARRRSTRKEEGGGI
jgi:hypothetical protein